MNRTPIGFAALSVKLLNEISENYFTFKKQTVHKRPIFQLRATFLKQILYMLIDF